MTQKLQFAKLIPDKSFLQIQRTFKKHFRLGLETTNAQGKMLGKMCSPDCMLAFCKMVRSVPEGLRRCDEERLRSLKIAFDTGQSYITICHAGIVLGLRTDDGQR